MSNSKNYLNGIYQIVELGNDKGRAEILFDGCLKGTPFLYVGGISDVNRRVNALFPNVRNVPNRTYRRELSHIKKFSRRTERQHESVNLCAVANILEPQADPWMP